MATDHQKYLLAYQERLLGTEQGFLSCTAAELAELDVDAQFPLAEVNGIDYGLALLSSDHCLPRGVTAEQLCGLRTLLGLLDGEAEYTLLSAAAQIATWHASFRYCPRCASELQTHASELAKVCGQCGHHQYPRISPCIIVLVRKGDRCLLAHARKFADKRYSTLAGFIEAGESAEHAVAREVMEEVGIQVKNVEYCFSQSWPFPHSLMLGFMADYESGEITPDGIEILEADWFGVDNLPTIPPKFTIARRLIDRFLRSQGVEPEADSALFFAAE